MVSGGRQSDDRMNRLGRKWDTFDAYLFDIDGTLLQCSDAVHYFAFCHVLEQIAGKPLTLEGVTAHGNTDIGILRDAFVLAGVEESQWRPRLAEIREQMCDFVQHDAEQVCIRVMPQAHEVLRHLSRRGAKLGVATGNLKRIGEIKLRRASLLEYFDFAAWSDEFEYRVDVFSAAAAFARNTAGAEASLCVVGDTPADVAAAHANGLPVIAVATGIYSFEDLEAADPEHCIRSFAYLLGAD